MSDLGPFASLPVSSPVTAGGATPLPDDTDLGPFATLPVIRRGSIAEAGTALARGAIAGAGEALSGPAALVGMPESGLAKTGEAITQYGQRRFAPTPGRESEFLSNRVPEFVGAVGPATGAGLAASAFGSPIAGAATTAGIMAAQGAGSGAAEAAAAGATPGQQQAAAASGAAMNAALGLVPGGMLTRGASRVIPTLAETGLRGGAARTAAAAAEGAGLGAGGKVTGNLIAGQTYDPGRELTAGVPEAAAVTGAGMGLLHPLLGAGAPRRPPEPTPPAAPEAPQLMLPPPAAIPMHGPEGPPQAAP
jgi:hypothetical protein